MMRQSFALLLLLFTLYSLAQKPVVRAHLEPPSNIMVGQPVRLVVSVFVPNYFTGAPEFPEFEMENAIVVLPQDRPENSNTQINGGTWFGITQTYVIYPQQTGDFHIPPAQLTVPYAIAPPKSTTEQVTLPLISFHAAVPEAAKDLPYFLPTTQLTITQRWSPALKDLRTGDTIERTITVTANKVQSMLIPPLALDAPDGIRVYAGEPVTRDQKSARGDFLYGQRIESAKYLINKAGNYVLPPLKLTWWNLTEHRLVVTTLTEVKLSAATNPNYVEELPPPASGVSQIAPVKKANLWTRYRLSMLAAAGLLFLLLLMYWLHHVPSAIKKRYESWCIRRRSSEAYYFRNLQRACLRNDPVQSYIWLLKWFRSTNPEQSLQESAIVVNNHDLLTAIDELAIAIYAKNSHETHWRGANLAILLRQLRHHQCPSPSKERLLAEMNPPLIRQVGHTVHYDHVRSE